MNGLTVCDWGVVLAAYAYENTGRETMSDASYERESAAARRRGTKIPGFLSYTGSWVNSLDRELVSRVLQEAWARNDGKDDLHGPAIKAAVEACGLTVSCCLQARGYTCYGEGEA